MIKYDLHSHTKYSDGSLSAQALIALAIERG
ncbi:MAG: putative metal-dependent phosphoesterase TrpH, partial [Parasphingorhabdus sp.]